MTGDAFELLNHKKNPTFKDGDRCVICDAFLSIYNATNQCFCHNTKPENVPAKEQLINQSSAPGFHSQQGIHISEMQYNGQIRS